MSILRHANPRDIVKKKNLWSSTKKGFHYNTVESVKREVKVSELTK